MAQPVTIEAEFGGKDSFVDLTGRTVSFSISRGRQDYTQPFQTGRATVVMRNLDGELDPDNSAGTYFGEILTGRRIRITSNEGSLLYEERLYVGFIEDFTLDYDIGGDAIVTISCVDGLSELAQREIADGTAVVEQTTGARVTAILNLTEVDYSGAVNISTGQSTCEAGTASGNALTYLHQMERTEQGALFVNKAGVLRFLDRYELLADSTVTFSDDGSDTDYESLRRLVTATELYNRLAANRPSQADVIEDDATSQTTYGVRYLDLGEVFFGSDAEVTDMLDYALVRYANQSPRIAEVTTLLDSKSTIAVSQLCQLELSESATVEFTPPNVSQISIECSIESIRHDYTVGGGWRLTFGFTPRDVSSYLRLDDAVLGKLDSNVLGF
jgi:hypothetical protein